MTNLIKRSLTGIVLIAVIIGAILLGEFFFIALNVILIILCLKEFYEILPHEHIVPQKWHGILLGIATFFIFYLYKKGIADEYIFLPLIPFVFNIFIIELFRKNKYPILNIAYTILGIVYIAFPFALLNFIVFKETTYIYYSPYMCLAYFGLLWMYDTLAYVTGSLFGRNYLFPRISPKKTWEGLIGGAIFTIITAWIYSYYSRGHTFIDWLVVALIIIVYGTIGDLFESMLKRSVNIKESGYMLPGHGGFLDRFDSFLFSAPIVIAYFVIVYWK
jgi:phosphatidate cytidylyltransferase